MLFLAALSVIHTIWPSIRVIIVPSLFIQLSLQFFAKIVSAFYSLSALLAVVLQPLLFLDNR